MKKIKISIIVLMFAVLACVLLYAGKRWYSHESEVNAKLREIQTATGTIADALSEKEAPYIDQLGKTYLQEIIDRFDGSKNNVYLKLAAGKPVRILIVGDSITAQDWTAEIADQISYHFGSECQLTNLSMGGNTSYAGYVRANSIGGDPYDLALICFGQNDSAEDFGIFYEALIRSVVEKNPHIHGIAVLESSQKTYTDKIKMILDIAGYYDFAVADTITSYSNSEYSYEALSPDGVHPGELGKELYLNTVMNVVFEKVKEAVYNMSGETDEGRRNVREDTLKKPAIYPETVTLEECTFIPADQFARSEEMRFSIDLPDCKGLLGIYCSRIPGKNSIQLFCGEKLVCEYNEEFNHSFIQEMIFLLDSELHEIKGDLCVVFNTQEQAESFRGLAVSNISDF